MKIKIQENNNNQKILINDIDFSSIIKKYEIARTDNIRENNLILTISLDNVELDIKH